MKTRYYGFCAVLIVLSLLATLAAYSHLPEPVPTHWNAHGVVDGYSPRWSLFVVAPGIMLALVALFAALPWLSPRRFDVRSFEPTTLYLMALVVAMMAYIHAVILWNAAVRPLDILLVTLGGASILVAGVGNVMGKVRRNFFIGIRTPWTLASERVWYATHRLAGKTLVLGGIAGLAVAFAGAPLWLWVALTVLATIFPLAYSLVLYKRLERAGELGGEPT